MLATYDIERLDTDSAVFPSDSQFTASPTTPTLPLPGGPVPLPGNPPQSSTTPFTITANGGNSGLTSGIYLQDEWLLTEALTLNYGVRYDRFDVTFDHEDQVSPRVNLVWRIDPATVAHIGYARYFMPPTLQYVPLSTVKKFEYTTDAPFNEGDAPPKVERDHYFDAGLSRTITPPWHVTVDSFCKLARIFSMMGSSEVPSFSIILIIRRARSMARSWVARTSKGPFLRMETFRMSKHGRRTLTRCKTNSRTMSWITCPRITSNWIIGPVHRFGRLLLYFSQRQPALYGFPLWQRPAGRVCESRKTSRLYDSECGRGTRVSCAFQRHQRNKTAL